MADDPDGAVAAWEAEYARGRYRDDPPVAFVDDILAAAADLPSRDALYVGCGNGRNLDPLVRGGLDVVGIDISPTAIAQLRELLPDRADRLLVGDLSTLQADAAFSVVVGIQVFQHGTRTTAHAHVRDAQARVAPGGLFCLRVNAVGTDVWPSHEVTERHPDGGFTVRYLTGAKAGLDIHFFAQTELEELFADFESVMPLRLSSTVRTTGPGQWSQWEAIWRQA